MSTFEIVVSLTGGIVSLIATGAIPWAYMVGVRLARIESVISDGMKHDIVELRAAADNAILRLTNVEQSVAVLKSQLQR